LTSFEKVHTHVPGQMAGYIQVVLEGGVQDVGLIAPRHTMALKRMSAGKFHRAGMLI